MAEEYGDARLERCRAFMPVPGPLQTVQRVEFWCAIIALQSYWPCRLGIDKLDVASSICRLLDHGCLTKPLSSVKDGDLVVVIQHVIRARRQDTVRVTKVKGHATETDVQQGKVGEEDRFGNEEAASPAGTGALLNAWDSWYPVISYIMDSWLRCLGSRLIMMGGEVLPLIRWFVIKGVRGSSVRLISGLTLILRLSVGHLAF